MAPPDRAGHYRTRGQGNIASRALAARPLAAMANGDADTLEAQILEIQELGLGHGISRIEMISCIEI